MLNPQLTQHIVNFDTTADAAGDGAVSKSSCVSVSTVENNHEHSSANDDAAEIDTPGQLLLDFRADLLPSLSFLLVISILCVLETYSILLSIGFGIVVGSVLQSNLCFRHVHVSFFRHRRLEQRNEWSEMIVALLGSVGAPLIFDLSESNLPDDMLKFLSSFVRSQVELIVQLNDSIDLVRRGTSLMFGVGPAHIGIDRVERAALSRWSKHSKDRDNVSGRMPVSLPTLRKRIHEILVRQIEGLLKVSGQACIDEQQSKPDVITLSLLSSKNAYSINLLANVVEQSARSVDDIMYRAMDHCAHETEILRKYIAAAIEHADLISTSAANPEKSGGPALSLLSKVESIRIALLNCHDNECSDHQLQLGDLPTGWATVEKLVQQFGAAFEQTTQQLKHGQSSGVSPFDSDNKNNTSQQHDGKCQVDVSYTSQTDHGHTVRRCLKVRDESETCHKTLVFSGVSAHRKARSRNRAMQCPLVSSGFLSSHTELVDELNKRLRSLPPVDELNVRNGAVVDTNDDESKSSAKGPCDNVRVGRFAAAEAIDTAPSNLSSSFLGELQDSIAARLGGFIDGQALHED